MPNITMSVHGNAFCSQQEQHRSAYTVPTYIEDRQSVVDYYVPDTGMSWGWGRTFFQTGWYHVPMPNVMYFDNQPIYLDEVFISTDRRNMRFDVMHMWQRGAFLWTGAPNSESTSVLQFLPRDSGGQRMSTNAGLGISLHFTQMVTGGYVTFFSALVELRSTR